MSEIERAIECFNNKVWSGELFESEVDMYNAVNKVLRAELERDKNPLTCDGCKDYDRRFSMARPCVSCIRSVEKDYYESKGEK